MAKTVGENVDIIVGGHTHSLLWNGTAPSHEVVAGTYPEYEEADNKPGHKVSHYYQELQKMSNRTHYNSRNNDYNVESIPTQ